MRLTKTTMIAAMIGAITAGATLAETPHEMRSAMMKAQGKQLGILGAMVQGKAPYDAAAASAAATELDKLANADWMPAFPADSLDGKRAMPEIASNMDDFMAKYEALGAATTALVAVAGTDLDALKAAFGPVGAACGACHKSYRAPE
ncbi:c-type cytochrome [Frigidibacter sp. ROC022]|uniref:c-type cytochrome n=1 Tax=Frigidibacter sp. ROC022 TaxID=2971796 RepID=UPI00215A4D0B|nr:cytochrome c [Frigidibacter sp. ROC022]MCR8723589.1 cytochrome c [Frigidibacter sp. ROC022]